MCIRNSISTCVGSGICIGFSSGVSSRTRTHIGQNVIVTSGIVPTSVLLFVCFFRLVLQSEFGIKTDELLTRPRAEDQVGSDGQRPPAADAAVPPRSRGALGGGQLLFLRQISGISRGPLVWAALACGGFRRALKVAAHAKSNRSSS